VVKDEDSQLSGCGFESRRRILDGVSEASYYIGKRNKGSQMGHTKKNIQKNILIIFYSTVVKQTVQM
jgi:GTPase